MCQLSSSTSPFTRAFISSRSSEAVLRQRLFGAMIGGQSGQHVIEAVVILGNVLILEGEDQHFFFVEADLGGPGGPAVGRLFGDNEFIAADASPFPCRRPRSRYGTSMMDTFGSSAEMAGGRAAMGSSRYSLTSSSLNGTEAQK